MKKITDVKKSAIMSLGSYSSGILARLVKYRQEQNSLAYYRALRVLYPLIDRAIYRTIEVTGDVTINAKTPQLQALADEFLRDFTCETFKLNGFPAVNKGYNRYLDTVQSYAYEGTRIVRELLTDDAGRVTGAYIPEPSTITFRQGASGSYDAFILDRNKYQKLEANQYLDLFYVRLTNSDPDAGSVLEGLGYLIENVLSILSSVSNYYVRVGDPSFFVQVQEESGKQINPLRNPTGISKSSVINSIASKMSTLFKGRQEGKTGDIIEDIPEGYMVDIKTIGSDALKTGLDVSPAIKTIDENIVAKFGIPSWMLARYWSTSEALGKVEIILLKSDAKSRQKAIETGIVHKDFEMWLLTRGYSQYSAKDYELEWEGIDFADSLQVAQIEKTEAETDKITLENLVTLMDSTGDIPGIQSKIIDTLETIKLKYIEVK